MNDDKPYIEEWHLKSELNIRKVWDVLLAKWHWFAISTGESVYKSLLFNPSSTE